MLKKSPNFQKVKVNLTFNYLFERVPTSVAHEGEVRHVPEGIPPKLDKIMKEAPQLWIVRESPQI